MRYLVSILVFLGVYHPNEAVSLDDEQMRGTVPLSKREMMDIVGGDCYNRCTKCRYDGFFVPCPYIQGTSGTDMRCTEGQKAAGICEEGFGSAICYYYYYKHKGVTSCYGSCEERPWKHFYTGYESCRVESPGCGWAYNPTLYHESFLSFLSGKKTTR